MKWLFLSQKMCSRTAWIEGLGESYLPCFSSFVVEVGRGGLHFSGRLVVGRWIPLLYISLFIPLAFFKECLG